MFLWCSYRFGNTFYYKNPLPLFVFFNDHGVQPRAYWLSRWTGCTATLHRAATLEKIQFTCPRGKRRPFCLWCFIFDDNSYKSGPFSRSSLSFTIFYCGYQIPIICTAAIIWLFSSTSMALFFWNKRLHRTFVGFIVVICFMVSTFSYVGIYYIVRKHQRQIHIQKNIVEGFRSWNKHPAFEEKCCEHILVLYRSYSVLFPIFVFITLTGVFGQKWKVLWSFSATVVFMNSSVNPFLHCCRIRELRTAVLNTLRKMLCRKSVQKLLIFIASKKNVLHRLKKESRKILISLNKRINC